MRKRDTSPDLGRLSVIKNIEGAVLRGDFFKKVEINDPVVTESERERIILPFDLERRRIFNRIKAEIAVKIAHRATLSLNKATEVTGLENWCGVEGGAIITSNHYNPMDSTVIRYMSHLIGREGRLNILIQETNALMPGRFGFMMRNCKTLPVSKNPTYMARELKGAIGRLLARGEDILIYPEGEMWFNYRKPRGSMPGAYYYAASFDVPIIPCFVEMRELPELGRDGFYKIKHTLHVMPPIYPDKTLPKRERYLKMQSLDDGLKRECYERVYGEACDTSSFIASRDIAGFRMGGK